MRRASLPYTRRYLSIALSAWICVMALGAPVFDAAGGSGTGAGATQAVRWSGNGTWGPEGGAAGPAHAEWILIGGNLHTFRVSQGETPHDCYVAAQDAPQNETRCQGRVQNHTALLALRTDNATWTGRFTATTHDLLLASPEPHTPSLVPGFIVATLASVLLVTSLILAVLFVQERRVARYLVRRLYEETKGRLPPDWPANMRHQWIARIFIRGKN